MVGRACGLPEGQGVRPGTYCEPKMTSVGSQDTTGPMTRDELKDLACLGFSADLVMQSFCHTAAYPKKVDVKMHHELPDFISHPRRRLAAPGRRRDPQLAQPPADARHRRHRRRQPHALPDRHQLPGRLRPGRLRRRHRRDAAGHARIGAGALQGQDAARRHAARPGQRDSAVRHQGGPADGREEGQEEHLLGPHPRDRRPAGPEGRASLRAERRLGRALGRRLHGAPEQGADHRVHQQQHHADALDDRRRLCRRPHAGAPHRRAGSLAEGPATAARATPTPNTPPSSRSTWPTSTSRSWPARTTRTT